MHVLEISLYLPICWTGLMSKQMSKVGGFNVVQCWSVSEGPTLRENHIFWLGMKRDSCHFARDLPWIPSGCVSGMSPRTAPRV